MSKFQYIRKALLGGASVLSIAMSAGPALAQDTAQIETVVVTARRAAMESAAKLKENANQIVDAVVADDAGKLPDNSITEVLQRVSGVTITHFGAPNDPDHPSVEGSGVAVRGMTQVNSTLNGREAFSANGGRALLWEDVPPELMAAVNVYKSSTADQIEGGVGGSVDLRTHMPFDFDGQTVKGSIGANYGDMVKRVRPSGSAMYSNRFDTKIGEIGILFDFAFSDIASRDDAIQVAPFFPHNDGASSDINAGAIYNPDWSRVDGTVWIPSGVDYRTQFFDRKRAGLYEAMQWRPTSNLELYQTAFVSYYQTNGSTYEFMDEGGNGMGLSFSTVTWSIPNFIMDAGHNVVQADALMNTYFRWWTPQTCATNQCSLATADTRADRANMRTTDLTEGFRWDASDTVKVSGAFQYVHSTQGGDSNTLQANVMVPYFSLDLRGTYPVTNMAPSTLQNNSNYNWSATMDDHNKNSASEIAFNTDVDFVPGNWGFWKSFRAGVRGAIRKENDRDTGYDFKELGIWYRNGNMTFFNHTAPNDVVLQTFPNYFRGAAVLPSSVWFPSLTLAQTYSDVYEHHTYSYSANDGYTPRTLDNHSLSYAETKSFAGYVLGNFANETWLGLPLNGNVGLRVVYDHNFSSGYLRQLAQTGVLMSAGGTAFNTPDTFTYREGGRDFWVYLPSLNIRVQPTDSTNIRLALSESMGQLGFNYMKAGGDMSFNQINSVIAGYQVNTGQPDLKPQLSRNADLAFEWYGGAGDEAHVSLFYKSIKNYITYGLSTNTFAFNLGSNGIQNETAAVYNYFNARKETAIRGFEVGGRKFADFLPSPFDGLGAEANFTYIDSRAPGDVSYDMHGNLITGLPVDLLSRYSYNVAAMYEKKPFSIRAAWTWRSKYLLTAAGSNGNYAAADNDTVCIANNFAAGGTGANPVNGQCYYSLPIFSKAYGQFDASVQYEFNDNVSLSVEGQNLLNAETKTTMGYGSQLHNRSWFVTDRRISAALHVNF